MREKPGTKRSEKQNETRESLGKRGAGVLSIVLRRVLGRRAMVDCGLILLVLVWCSSRRGRRSVVPICPGCRRRSRVWGIWLRRGMMGMCWSSRRWRIVWIRVGLRSGSHLGLVIWARGALRVWGMGLRIKGRRNSWRGWIAGIRVLGSRRCIALRIDGLLVVDLRRVVRILPIRGCTGIWHIRWW